MAFRSFEWDCDKSGCFNKSNRLDFSLFQAAGVTGWSDIDGMTEVAGRGLLLEMKSPERKDMSIPIGQRIMFERLTQGGILTVLCIIGTDKGATIYRAGEYFNGKWRGWKPADLAFVQSFVNRWAGWARSGGKNGSEEDVSNTGFKPNVH